MQKHFPQTVLRELQGVCRDNGLFSSKPAPCGGSDGRAAGQVIKLPPLAEGRLLARCCRESDNDPLSLHCPDCFDSELGNNISATNKQKCTDVPAIGLLRECLPLFLLAPQELYSPLLMLSLFEVHPEALPNPLCYRQRAHCWSTH